MTLHTLWAAIARHVFSSHVVNYVQGSAMCTFNYVLKW